MRDRLLMPVLVPAGALATIGLLIFSVGKILLEIDPHFATAVAVCIGLFILGICSLLATGPKLPPTLLYTLTALPASVILAIGLFIAVRPSESASGGEAPAAAVTQVTQIMTDNKFSVTNITVPANQEITVDLQNKGAAIHNFVVQNVKDASGNDIRSENLSGGKTQTLTFTITTPGSYPFHCEFHPVDMKGTLVVQ